MSCHRPFHCHSVLIIKCEQQQDADSAADPAWAATGAAAAGAASGSAQANGSLEPIGVGETELQG
jgi:hypothetical protein